MVSTILVASLAWGIAAPAPKVTPKNDAKKAPSIVGSWRVNETTVAGNRFPVKDLIFEFTADGKFIKHDSRGRRIQRAAPIRRIQPRPRPIWIGCSRARRSRRSKAFTRSTATP